MLRRRDEQLFAVLTDAQIARVAPHGRVRQVERGILSE